MTSLAKLSQYGKGFQLKVLGALLTDKKFVLNTRDLLRVEYFDSDAHKWIVETLVKYFDKYHTTITMDILKVELQKVENDILQTAVKSELRGCYESTQEDLEYVQEEFTTFAKNQELKTALLNSADLLNQGDFDGIRGMIEKAMRAGMDKNMGHEYNKDIESRYRQDYRPTIPTPWPILNEGIQGGWGPGDLIIMFGNPGGGKSWTMVAAAAHAVQLGFNVNYYTLELGEDYVGKRFDCYFTGYGIEEVNKHRSEVEKIVGKLKGKLIVKEYPPKGASINTIKSHIQKCIDMDHKPDLVVIDYVDYLKAPSKHKFADKKDEIDDVFIATKGLAKELKIPILTPSQVNRMGAKDNVIEGDKAAGSYDKMMVADICLSLSRMKEDKVLGTGRIHVMKNRYGMDGMTYDAKVDTNNGHIEILGNAILDDNGEKPRGGLKEIANKFFELEGKSPF
jgi:replicative DNA helicase